jgi:hypothetical protein
MRSKKPPSLFSEPLTPGMLEMRSVIMFPVPSPPLGGGRALRKSAMPAKGLGLPSAGAAKELIKFVMPVGVAMSDGRVCMKVLSAVESKRET